MLGLLASVAGKLIMSWKCTSILRQLTLQKIEQEVSCLHNCRQVSATSQTICYEIWSYSFLLSILCPSSSSNHAQYDDIKVEM